MEVRGTGPASMEKDFVSPTKVSQVSITSEKIYNFYYSPKLVVSAPYTTGPSRPAFVAPPGISTNLGCTCSFFNNLGTMCLLLHRRNHLKVP